MSSTVTKSTGLLFKAPMVRALLEGRKTQTRRIVKGPDTASANIASAYVERRISEPAVCRARFSWTNSEGDELRGVEVFCPYGVVGDELWVRETFRRKSAQLVAYKADGACGAMFNDGERDIFSQHGYLIDAPGRGEKLGTTYGLAAYGERWQSSRFMPKRFSRITLRITDVRVQRVQDISEADILAEGVTVPIAAEMSGIPWSSIPTLYDAWRLGWCAINGEESWKLNVWLWALTLERVLSGGAT